MGSSGTGALQHVLLFLWICSISLDQSTHNGEPCKSNGGGRRQKAREAQQAGRWKGCGQWKSCKEGGQDERQEGEENAGKDDQKQEDCSRVLKPQTESFKEY